MNEYYPFIAKAVFKLEKNTFEARQDLYERARNALVTGLERRVLESELAGERRALEAAIKRIESESTPALCIEVESVRPIHTNRESAPGLCNDPESLQIIPIEPESLQITPFETQSIQITPEGEIKSVPPAGTSTVNSEQYRRRAVMLRAIGTPRCLELAVRCEQLAIEMGRREAQNTMIPPMAANGEAAN